MRELAIDITDKKSIELMLNHLIYELFQGSIDVAKADMILQIIWFYYEACKTTPYKKSKDQQKVTLDVLEDLLD